MQSKSGPMPEVEPIDPNQQHGDLRPVVEHADAIGEERREFGDAALESLDSLSLELVEPALGNEVGALPVIAPV